MAAPVLTTLIERHLHDFSVRKPSPHTVAAYRRDLLGVAGRLADLAGVEVDQLTVAHLRRPALRAAFADWATDHAAASIRRAWSAWNAFFSFLVAEELLDANPMSAVAAPKATRGRAKVIPVDDVASRLLQTAASTDPTARHPWPWRDVALVATFLVTGIRLSEAVDLNLSSIDGPPGARRIAVVGKGNRARTIPIETELEVLLDAYLEERRQRFPRQRTDERRTPLFIRADNGERPSRQQVEGWIDKLYRRAGIRNQVPPGALVHALRHTFATSALDHGIDVVELQELLGHSSLDTTRRYLDATAAGLREAIAHHPAQAALRRFAAEGRRQTVRHDEPGDRAEARRGERSAAARQSPPASRAARAARTAHAAQPPPPPRPQGAAPGPRAVAADPRASTVEVSDAPAP